MNKEIDISNVELKTERLQLRPFKETDLNDFYEYAKVPGVGEAAGWSHHKSIEESKTILEMFIAEKKTLAIVKDSKVIGSIGIENYNIKDMPELDDKQCRELGFVLSKNYWGQGLMREACCAVISYLFNIVKLDCITCGHFTCNERSKKTQLSLGFKEIKNTLYHTKDGRTIECVISIINKEDWA